MFEGDDGQRFKNFMFFKLWMTDKEVEEVRPVMAFLGLIIVVISAVAWLFGAFR